MPWLKEYIEELKNILMKKDSSYYWFNFLKI